MTSRSPIPTANSCPPPAPDAIVIDRIRGWQPGAPPSLAELLASIRTRDHTPRKNDPADTQTGKPLTEQPRTRSRSAHRTAELPWPRPGNLLSG
jgi:hypothetical protein